MFRISSVKLGKALLLVELLNGAPTASTLAAVTAAAKLGPVTALVAGKNVAASAKAVAAVAGIAEVVSVEGEHYARGLPEEVEPLLVEIANAGNFTHVVAGSSAFSKGIIPRAAAKLDVMPLSDVTGIESEDTFTRLTYAGNAINVVVSKDKVKFLTIRGTSFERAGASTTAAAAIREAKPTPPTHKSKWVEDVVTKNDRPDLTTAANVVVGGRGLKNKEGFEKIVFPLADKLKAAIGATRAVVDAGDAPAEWQVGQTGKVIAPNLYVGLGVSGAIQHLAGMKDSKTIVVVNTDPDAPFFQVADYALVGDAFTVGPELVTKL